jgi:Carboxypeptidase regulatory-like domain
VKLRLVPLLSRAILAALCAAAPIGSAQPAKPSPSATRTQRAATYRISGKVVDAHTGAALGRASVRISDVKERTETQSVTTGDDGSFTFDGLSVGKYSLTAAHHGYIEQAFEQHDDFSTAIAVGPGLSSEDLIFKLTAEGIISGSVTDEAGEPVRSAQVRLFQDEDTNGIRTTRQKETVMTDDLGDYELANLQPGAYFLVVTAHPWYAQRLRQMQPGSDDQDNGQPQNLDVAYPATYYPGVTDQDAATPIPIKGGDRLQADITLAAQQAIRLRVRTPAGDAGGEGGLQRNGASVMLSQSIFGQVEPLPMQTVSSGGSIEIEGILPGHYDVTVSHFVPGQGEGATRRFTTDIASGMTELAEDTAVDAITVTGKAVAVNGKLPPMSGISLRAANSRRPQYGPINDAGEFTMEVAPGTYEVVGNINGMHFMGLKASGGELTGRMLTVKTGDTPKLEIVAGTGHGEVEGTALRNGKPASAVLVLLAPEDPRNNEILFRRDQSDSDGTFDLGDVFPGRYRLLAIENGWELEWANPNVLQAFLAKSVPLEIKSGDHLKQTVEVQSR